MSFIHCSLIIKRVGFRWTKYVWNRFIWIFTLNIFLWIFEFLCQKKFNSNMVIVIEAMFTFLNFCAKIPLIWFWPILRMKIQTCICEISKIPKNIFSVKIQMKWFHPYFVNLKWTLFTIKDFANEILLSDFVYLKDSAAADFRLSIMPHCCWISWFPPICRH